MSDKRSEFQDRIKVPSKELGPKEDIMKIVEEWAKREEMVKRRQYKKTPTKTKKKRKLRKPNPRAIRGIFKRLAPVAMAVIAATYGGYKIMENINEQKPDITLADSLENGKTLKDLGIDYKQKEELEKIKKTLPELKGMNNSELKTLANELYDLQNSILRTKLYNALGEDAEVDTYYSDEHGWESIISTDDETYRSPDFIDLDNSPNVGQGILDFQELKWHTKEVVDSLTDGDVKRNDIIKYLESAVEGTDKFAASELVKNENGDLELRTIKRSELEIASSQENKNTKEDDDLER